MRSFRTAILSGCTLLCAACASNTIVPTYETSNPHIKVGDPAPVDVGPTVENAGSFCLEITEKWHQDGKTPDGQPLWAKDTARRVVPCNR